MSPFAQHLRKLRIDRKLQQKDLAEIIGCEPSYISSLETDAKVPPQKEKLIQFFKKLDLTHEEQSSLLTAAEKSKRSIRLPLKAATQLFEVCHALEYQLPTIGDMQLELIAFALRINQKEMGAPKM